jgi:2-polyprenyl-3-methyl-5-hydroxy-6-metoxy-1,4-benzoquinol methylase
MPASCPICGASTTREVFRFDPARWIPSIVDECRRCGVLFKRFLPSARPLPEYYDGSYARSEYWSHAAAAERDIDRFLQVLASTAHGSGQTLLDIGCGQGQFLRRAAAHGFTVAGVEMNEALAERAREGGLDVVRGDFMASALDGRRFDVVTMFDLIEHLPDPVAALKRCRGLLAPGGRLILYTPNHAGLIVKTARLLHRLSGGRIDGPVVELFDCLHVVFFDPVTLRRALDAADFDVERARTWSYDPRRSQQATGLAAAALRGLELVGPLAGGRFRLMMVARAR